MGPSLELYRCSHGQLFPTFSLFSLSFLRGSVSQILTLLLSKIQMRIFSIFHTRGLSNIRKDATTQVFWRFFLSFWNFMRHTVSGIHVLPLKIQQLYPAYCRIQTFLMDLSPGFYEALPSADLKTTHQGCKTTKITPKKVFHSTIQNENTGGYIVFTLEIQNIVLLFLVDEDKPF